MQDRLPPSWTAVVLAGGRGARMGGIDKSQCLLQGRTLLDHVVTGIPGGIPCVVVGPEQAVARPARFVRESPAFGGPVAAVAAALPLVGTPIVGIVAGDMPRVGPLVSRLARAWSGEQAVVVVDASGRQQHLCSVLSTAALIAALTSLGRPEGRSMVELLAQLDVVNVHLDDVESRMVVDVDVPEDLSRLT